MLETAAVSLAKEEEKPNPSVNIFPVQEETKEAIRLEEEIPNEDSAKSEELNPTAILKSKDVEKPFFEVKKIQVPIPPPKEAPPAGLEETIRMPSLWDEFLYYIPPFLKNRFLMLTAMTLLSLSLLIILPLKAGYDEAKLELDSLLKELGKNKPSRILDREGNKVSEIYQKKTGSMKLTEYPELLRKIILTVEDRSFYRHSGIDLASIVRAGYKNLIHLRYIQGASTITQ
ncbi:MAG TPA: transglycosylase domain-containing protein, partial [Leptospiraceae bacterium]|nr:transglycosylase domain-containing protein [Leptospiraceae bacterium]